MKSNLKKFKVIPSVVEANSVKMLAEQAEGQISEFEKEFFGA